VSDARECPSYSVDDRPNREKGSESIIRSEEAAVEEEVEVADEDRSRWW
jgi:hypothetical protein